MNFLAVACSLFLFSYVLSTVLVYGHKYSGTVFKNKAGIKLVYVLT